LKSWAIIISQIVNITTITTEKSFACIAIPHRDYYQHKSISIRKNRYEAGARRLLLGGVGPALLAEADDGGDEAAVVLHPLVRAAAGLLLLVLRGDLGRLAAHLTGTSERSVHLTCDAITTTQTGLRGQVRALVQQETRTGEGEERGRGLPMAAKWWCGGSGSEGAGGVAAARRLV
jgi:hypothetical protein